MNLDTRKLWRAPTAALLRLARFVGAPTPQGGCDCHRCRGRLVEHVMRRL